SEDLGLVSPGASHSRRRRRGGQLERRGAGRHRPDPRRGRRTPHRSGPGDPEKGRRL
ncbi:hypothetical protein LTR94_028807, partial [Friedmanniomyces endolithicus]